MKTFLNFISEDWNMPLGAGSIRYEGLHRKLSRKSFSWYKMFLGEALQSSVVVGPTRIKEFGYKKVQEGIIIPKNEEDLKNAFKLIRKYISRHKPQQWAKKYRARLKEIISEFGL